MFTVEERAEEGAIEDSKNVIYKNK